MPDLGRLGALAGRRAGRRASRTWRERGGVGTERGTIPYDRDAVRRIPLSRLGLGAASEPMIVRSVAQTDATTSGATDMRSAHPTRPEAWFGQRLDEERSLESRNAHTEIGVRGAKQAAARAVGIVAAGDLEIAGIHTVEMARAAAGTAGV